MMQTHIRSVAQFLTSSGPMIPCEGADDPTPTVVNMLLLLGLIVTVSDGPGTTLSIIGVIIVLFAVVTKIVFNFAVSKEPTIGGRMRRTLWVLMYHPALGRPYKALRMIRDSENALDLAAALIFTALFLLVAHLLYIPTW